MQHGQIEPLLPAHKVQKGRDVCRIARPCRHIRRKIRNQHRQKEEELQGQILCEPDPFPRKAVGKRQKKSCQTEPGYPVKQPYKGLSADNLIKARPADAHAGIIGKPPPIAEQLRHSPKQHTDYSDHSEDPGSSKPQIKSHKNEYLIINGVDISKGAIRRDRGINHKNRIGQEGSAPALRTAVHDGSAQHRQHVLQRNRQKLFLIVSCHERKPQENPRTRDADRQKRVQEGKGESADFPFFHDKIS